MGTSISVTAPSEQHELVFDIFRQVDNDMSEWKENSPLTQVNNAAGKEPFVVPEDLFKTVQRSLLIAETTSGAFDPTWASLWELWKFDGKNIVPSTEVVEAILPQVNWQKVRLNESASSVYLPKGAMLGLGGIAKGVALDLAREALIAKGVNDFMIVAGGQVLVNGLNNGRHWRVGIRDPEKEQDEYFAVLEVTDTCVSTSGNYEKFFFKDGVRYHHIIDPRTGFPAKDTVSVTVVCKDATLADALSTAMFVLGPVGAIELANKIEGVDALVIAENGDLSKSAGFPLN
jgi:thiamine biosynthesis lipoprotein